MSNQIQLQDVISAFEAGQPRQTLASKTALSKWKSAAESLLLLTEEERDSLHKSLAKKTRQGQSVISVIYPTTQCESLVPCEEALNAYLREFDKLRDPTSVVTREMNTEACKLFKEFCKQQKLIVVAEAEESQMMWLIKENWRQRAVR